MSWYCASRQAVLRNVTYSGLIRYWGWGWLTCFRLSVIHWSGVVEGSSWADRKILVYSIWDHLDGDAARLPWEGSLYFPRYLNLGNNQRKCPWTSVNNWSDSSIPDSKSPCEWDLGLQWLLTCWLIMRLIGKAGRALLFLIHLLLLRAKCESILD